MSDTLAKNLRGDRVDRLRLRAAYVVAPTASVDEVVREMRTRGVGCALVRGTGDMLRGIFTEYDFLARVVAPGLAAAKTTVERVMTPSPRTVAAHESIYVAVAAMAEGGFRHLPVLDADGRPRGVLAVGDVMDYLVEYFPAKVYNLPPTPDQTQPAREGA